MNTTLLKVSKQDSTGIMKTKSDLSIIPTDVACLPRKNSQTVKYSKVSSTNKRSKILEQSHNADSRIPTAQFIEAEKVRNSSNNTEESNISNPLTSIQIKNPSNTKSTFVRSNTGTNVGKEPIKVRSFTFENGRRVEKMDAYDNSSPGKTGEASVCSIVEMLDDCVANSMSSTSLAPVDAPYYGLHGASSTKF